MGHKTKKRPGPASGAGAAPPDPKHTRDGTSTAGSASGSDAGAPSSSQHGPASVFDESQGEQFAAILGLQQTVAVQGEQIKELITQVSSQNERNQQQTETIVQQGIHILQLHAEVDQLQADKASLTQQLQAQRGCPQATSGPATAAAPGAAAAGGAAGGLTGLCSCSGRWSSALPTGPS